MIETLRAADDDITILVAQVIPYLNTEGGTEEASVAAYNAQIVSQIAPLSTAKSKVVVVDQHAGFDICHIQKSLELYIQRLLNPVSKSLYVGQKSVGLTTTGNPWSLFI